MVSPQSKKKSIHHNNGLGYSAGFTFIEIILALGLLSILTAIFGMGLVAAMQSYAFSRSNANLTQKGQMALQRMARELSELFEITAFSNEDATIMFKTADKDDISAETLMGIYYNAEDRTIRLCRNLAETDTLPPQTGEDNVLIDGVESFSLICHPDSSGAPMAIHAVDIAITLDRPEAPSNPLTFSRFVHLRNNRNDGAPSH